MKPMLRAPDARVSYEMMHLAIGRVELWLYKDELTHDHKMHGKSLCSSLEEDSSSGEDHAVSDLREFEEALRKKMPLTV